MYNSVTMNTFRLWLFLPALPALACRPVIAIGWGELLIFLLLLLVLFGLPLWRFWKKWREFTKRQKD